MTVYTCTKVNIGLNVLRRRPDGYHDLETLFVPYHGFGDRLDVEVSDELSIQIFRKEGVDWDPMQDLTVKAWRLLKADFPQLPPVGIRLWKDAPVGAGLGGGSADAAFMLKALNELCSLGLEQSELAAYAARLGSDCAFFIGPAQAGGAAAGVSELCPMFGSGRGEILEPFELDLSAYELKVEIPLAAGGAPVAVSTREAYSGVVPRERRILSLREALKLPVEQWKGVVVNDFEASVCPLHPEIPAMIANFYRRGAVYSSMSGSGSSVFGIFPR